MVKLRVCVFHGAAKAGGRDDIPHLDDQKQKVGPMRSRAVWLSHVLRWKQFQTWAAVQVPRRHKGSGPFFRDSDKLRQTEKSEFSL